MRSCDQREAIVVVESFRDVLPECVASTSWTYAPSTPVVWIAPQQIAHRALVRHFLDAVEASNVVEGINAGGEATVKAEDLVVDEGSEWEVIEEISEEFPDVGIAILAQALIVEAIDLCDLSRFVVAAEDGDSGGISDLKSYKKGDGLDGVVASVDIVAFAKS